MKEAIFRAVIARKEEKAFSFSEMMCLETDTEEDSEPVITFAEFIRALSVLLKLFGYSRLLDHL